MGSSNPKSRLAWGILALGVACGPAAARSDPPIVLVPVARVSAEVVLAGQELPGSVGFLELSGGPEDSPSASMALPWPDGARIELRTVRGPDRSGSFVEVEARVSRGDDLLARSTRRLPLTQSGTTLWEAYRSQGRRIVLGVRVERQTRPDLSPTPTVGRPVAFRLFVERVEGDAEVLLETNDLHSFLGEPVGYSFRRGLGIDEENLRVDLLPARIVGDVVQVEVSLQARLPGENAPPPFRRQRTLFATRGVESAVSATWGDPPSGYRFRILAEF